jgi:Restriction alleviation protein Lar
MEVELLGCPFCGAKPEVETDERTYVIKCVADRCGVEPRTFALSNLQEVADEWNTRAQTTGASHSEQTTARTPSR